MTFGAPLLLFGLALLIPVLLAFVVRRQRDVLRVPSTLLWRRAALGRAQTRRFRSLIRLLALLACLAAVAALVVAAARPQGPHRFETVAIVVDVSASMAAGGVDAPIRQARRVAQRMLASRGQRDRYAIIAAAEVPERLAGPTSDAAMLDEAVGKLLPRRGSADLGAAIDLAATLVEAAADAGAARVVVLHDGGDGLGDAWHPRARVTVTERRVTAAARDNLGVVSFAVRGVADARGTGDREAMVTIATSSDRPRVGRVSVRADGTELAVRRVDIAPHGSADLQVPMHVPASRIDVRVAADDGVADALDLDDEATITEAARRPPRVLGIGVTEQGSAAFFVERALKAAGAGAIVRVPPDFGATPPEAGDIVVALGDGPTRAFEAPALYVGTQTGRLPIAAARELRTDAQQRGGGQTRLRSVAARDPLLRGVALDGVTIDRALAAEVPSGGRSLVELDGGAVVLAGGSGRGAWIYCGIDPVGSDLVLRVAFPVLVANALAALAGGADLAVADTVPRAEVTLRPAPPFALAADRFASDLGLGDAPTSPPGEGRALGAADPSRSDKHSEGKEGDEPQDAAQRAGAPASVVRPSAEPEPRWRLPLPPAVMLAAVAALLLGLEAWAWKKGWVG